MTELRTQPHHCSTALGDGRWLSTIRRHPRRLQCLCPRPRLQAHRRPGWVLPALQPGEGWGLPRLLLPEHQCVGTWVVPPVWGWVLAERRSRSVAASLTCRGILPWDLWWSVTVSGPKSSLLLARHSYRPVEGALLLTGPGSEQRGGLGRLAAKPVVSALNNRVVGVPSSSSQLWVLVVQLLIEL